MEDVIFSGTANKPSKNIAQVIITLGNTEKDGPIQFKELNTIKTEIGDSAFNNGKFTLATKLFVDMIQKNDFDEFLTLPAYSHI